MSECVDVCGMEMDDDNVEWAKAIPAAEIELST